MSDLSLKKKAYIIAGSFFLILGIMGIFIPLMPSTVFLLLAAACYTRGSERFYTWLINHHWFGGTIRDYRSGLGIPLRQKLSTMILLWATIGGSGYFFISTQWVKILLILIAFGVSWHLLSLKTKKEVISTVSVPDNSVIPSD